MHELSIATQMVSVVEGAAKEAGAQRVQTVYLRLGELAGVVREALEFAYGIATEQTLLEGSRLVIEPVGIQVRCEACDLEGPPLAPERLRCARCEEPTPQITAGRELEIRAIEYDAEGASPLGDPEASVPAAERSSAEASPRDEGE